MSQGGEVLRGPWNADSTFSFVEEPTPAVDGGDGSASVALPADQQSTLEAFAMRGQSDVSSDPVTGADLGKAEGDVDGVGDDVADDVPTR